MTDIFLGYVFNYYEVFSIISGVFSSFFGKFYDNEGFTLVSLGDDGKPCVSFRLLSKASIFDWLLAFLIF